MSLARPYSVGLRNVGSYEVSGQPFITGSLLGAAPKANMISSGDEIQIVFPYVTKSITLWNHSDDASAKLRFHLVTSSSIANHPSSRHYYELGVGESFSFTLKCKEAWLSAVSGDANWKLYASLTNIPIDNMYDLTGSGISS